MSYHLLSKSLQSLQFIDVALSTRIPELSSIATPGEVEEEKGIAAEDSLMGNF